LSNSNSFSNISIDNSYYGIYLYYSQYNSFSSLNISNCEYGFYLEISVSFNTIKDSKIINNNYGIRLKGTSENSIYNNLFNNSNNFIFVGTVFVTNYWNVTKQPGTNIWNSSLGYIGGNFWTNPNGNGYSDTCLDSNYDGFCDDPYQLNSNNIDYLPYKSPTITSTTTTTSTTSTTLPPPTFVHKPKPTTTSTTSTSTTTTLPSTTTTIPEKIQENQQVQTPSTTNLITSLFIAIRSNLLYQLLISLTIIIVLFLIFRRRTKNQIKPDTRLPSY
jgi:parallel beta-helix repeat protein